LNKGEQSSLETGTVDFNQDYLIP